MRINGAAPGSSTWALGQALITMGQATGGGVGAEEITAGSALVNGFDDRDAGSLEALGGAIGLAIGGVGGAAIGAGIGYGISGLVGGANDTSDDSGNAGINKL